MQVQGFTFRFNSKIPGSVQYSSIECGIDISVVLDEGEPLKAAIKEMGELVRESIKEQLRPAKIEQRVIAAGGEYGNVNGRD